MAEGSSRSPQQPVPWPDLEDDDDERYCMPTKTLTDKLMIAALVCVVVGLIVSTIGYLVPNQYVFNQELPAREMESIEIRHEKLTKTLNACIIAGMSCVAIGGLLTMTVFTATVIFADCECVDKKRTSALSERSSSNSRQYGSVLMGEMVNSK